MFRISACILALLLSCAPLSIAESENLISQDQIAAGKVNYKTVTVTQGDFVPTRSAAAEEYYPLVYSLGLDESGAFFEEYKVARGDEVREGDILATFTLESDDVELVTLQFDLENAQEALEKRQADEEEAAVERQRALLNAADPYERDLLLLQSERAELAFEQYQFNQQRSIDQIQERIDKILDRLAGNMIVSPVDGIVTHLEYRRAGQAVSEGEILIEVCSTDSLLLCVDNADSLLRYGMEVAVEVGPNNDRVKLKGRVVGSDALIPLSERTHKGYILLENAEDQKLNRPIVTGEVAQLKDVTLIDRSVLTQQGEEFYVTMLSDGVPVKKFVNCTVQNGVTKAWVLQGLEPGDEIIID